MTELEQSVSRLERLSLGDVAERLANGDCSSAQLTRDCLRRVRDRNPDINAFVWVDEVRALEAAKAADERRRKGNALSPLDGIPFGIKDNLDVVGMPTSNGIRRAGVAAVDAQAVAPWTAAGMVAIGKLNMHEAALGTTTENPHFGATRNPFNPSFSAGGSSGGSGAAVADFMCPMALGSDTMGSVRLPAASCGVLGWKPSRGVLGLRGMCLLDDMLDTAGPLVRTVTDLELLMVRLGLAGQDAADVSFHTLPDLASSPPASELAAVWSRVQRTFAPRELSVDGLEPSPLRRAALVTIEARLAREWDEQERAYMSEDLNAMLSFGDRVTEARQAAAAESIREAGRRIADALSTVDVVISLASPVPPTKLGAEVVPYQADYLLAANLAGAPALSVPAGLTADGLPVGVQLMAAPGRDRRLIDAARRLQEHGLLFERVPDSP